MAAREGDGEPYGVEIPWPEETPQERGRKYEKNRAREQGLRLHPGSGSGGIKHDASNDEILMEYKTATTSFMLNGKYLLGLFKQAVRQGKDAVMEIYFVKHRLIVTITIRRKQ